MLYAELNLGCNEPPGSVMAKLSINACYWRDIIVKNYCTS